MWVELKIEALDVIIHSHSSPSGKRVTVSIGHWCIHVENMGNTAKMGKSTAQTHFLENSGRSFYRLLKGKEKRNNVKQYFLTPFSKNKMKTFINLSIHNRFPSVPVMLTRKTNPSHNVLVPWWSKERCQAPYTVRILRPEKWKHSVGGPWLYSRF